MWSFKGMEFAGGEEIEIEIALTLLQPLPPTLPTPPSASYLQCPTSSTPPSPPLSPKIHHHPLSPPYLKPINPLHCMVKQIPFKHDNNNMNNTSISYGFFYEYRLWL